MSLLDKIVNKPWSSAPNVVFWYCNKIMPPNKKINYMLAINKNEWTPESTFVVTFVVFMATIMYYWFTVSNISSSILMFKLVLSSHGFIHRLPCLLR